MRTWLITFVLVVGCKDDKPKDDKPKNDDVKGMVDEASVDWARKQLPELDKQLASSDPGSASSTCAVIKPDMGKIKKADAKLAEDLERKCGRDLAVRSMTVAVERAEKDPGECIGMSSYEKMVTKANAESDPEVLKLRERIMKACAKK